MTQTSRPTRFMDGCHRYGLTPGLLIQLAGMIISLAYFTGNLNAQVKALQDQVKVAQTEIADRMTRVERSLDSLMLKMIK